MKLIVGIDKYGIGLVQVLWCSAFSVQRKVFIIIEFQFGKTDKRWLNDKLIINQLFIQFPFDFVDCLFSTLSIFASVIMFK